MILGLSKSYWWCLFTCAVSYLHTKAVFVCFSYQFSEIGLSPEYVLPRLQFKQPQSLTIKNLYIQNNWAVQY